MRKLDSKKWKLARENTLTRDKHCVLCNCTKKLNCHHIIARQFCGKDEELLYGDKNLVMLCSRHHFQVHKISAVQLFKVLSQETIEWLDRKMKDKYESENN